MERFREYLQQEFIRRTGRNENYSLRAFAQSLGVNHATLSGILSGRRPITKSTVEKLAPALELGPQEIQLLVNRDEDAKTKNSYYLLQQDAFNCISDWYFDAILELSLIPNINLEPKVISSAIGITELQARMALETLERLELFRRDKNGKLKIQHQNSTNILDPDFTNVAQKKYQKCVLDKSLQALSEVDRKDRDHTSTTMAIHKKDLPKAKEIIQKFRHDLNKFLQRDSKKFDEVYQLQVSFFPLTKDKGVKNENN